MARIHASTRTALSTVAENPIWIVTIPISTKSTKNVARTVVATFKTWQGGESPEEMSVQVFPPHA